MAALLEREDAPVPTVLGAPGEIERAVQWPRFGTQDSDPVGRYGRQRVGMLAPVHGPGPMFIWDTTPRCQGLLHPSVP